MLARLVIEIHWAWLLGAVVVWVAKRRRLSPIASIMAALAIGVIATLFYANGIVCSSARPCPPRLRYVDSIAARLAPGRRRAPLLHMLEPSTFGKKMGSATFFAERGLI